MSDLQCPATVVFASRDGIGGAGPSFLAGQNVAGVFVTASLVSDSVAHSAAVRLAGSAGCRLDVMAEVVDGATLRAGVDALTDLHRGETIVVVAPRVLIAGALGRDDLVDAPVTVTIDSGGWTVRLPP